MSKSPVSIVKDKFGDKAKLVAALAPLTTDALWLARVNPKKGLERVSNAKLLRLHSVLSEVKERFGTRDKLVEAICETEKRSKDEGYKKRISAYPTPRLFDLYRAAARRGGIKLAPVAGPAAAAPAAKPAAKAASKPKAETAAKSEAKPKAKPAAAAKKAPAAASKTSTKK